MSVVGISTSIVHQGSGSFSDNISPPRLAALTRTAALLDSLVERRDARLKLWGNIDTDDTWRVDHQTKLNIKYENSVLCNWCLLFAHSFYIKKYMFHVFQKPFAISIQMEQIFFRYFTTIKSYESGVSLNTLFDIFESIEHGSFMCLRLYTSEKNKFTVENATLCRCAVGMLTLLTCFVT